ncbi:MAG: class IV adenylate cyclase [Methanobrevibacter sp.]|jgi:adenylate cyclase class 2|nr:class IV adenylate cyclase [Candidatus Methanoflexus mossambicus]
MIEVEVKAKLNNKKELIGKLKSINAIYSHREIQNDIYYERNDIQFAKNDKALRIREIEVNNEKIVKITYKGSKIEDKSKTREEIEIAIEDKDKMRSIFDRLMFIESGNVKKTRDIYKYKMLNNSLNNNLNENLDENFEICIDNVEGLGNFVEIEIAIDEEINDDELINDKKVNNNDAKIKNKHVEIAIEKIYELFKELGINDGFERRSYLELLENKIKNL